MIIPKWPIRGKKISSVLMLSAIIVVVILILEGVLQKTQADQDESALGLDKIPELVIFQGNTLASALNPVNPEPKVVRKIKVIITAYSSTVWQTDDTPHITAAGTTVREGIIANNLLPFGTKVRMPEIYGNRVFLVEDRMHPRKGFYMVDVWFSDYWQALNFGAKDTYIEVLEG